MRESGALFTHTELASAIADFTFNQVPGAIVTSSDACVTALEAMNIVQIEPILGNSTRLPFYQELIPAGSVPPSAESSSFTYTFNNNGMHVDRSVIFSILIEKDGDSYNLAYSSFASIPHTVTEVEVGSEITIYLSFTPIETATCETVEMSVSLLAEDTPYTSDQCPALVITNVFVEEAKSYVVVANITNLLA